MPIKHDSHENRTWKTVMAQGSEQSDAVIRAAVVMAVVVGLYASSLHSYILFHSLIEFTTIAIGFTMFVLTWNARRFLTAGCLKVLGIGYGLIALIDLLHSLAYKGMGVFPGYGANLPTQLWIAARSLQALLLCLAPIFARRNLNERVFFALSLTVVSASAALVYSGAFPDCFIEGKGLTPFKIVSEYVISAFLVAALFLFIATQTAFNTRVFRFIAVSILCTIGSELAFTSYVSVYGPANMVGHFLKLAAFYLIYRAIIVTGFQEPLELIFRDLKQAEQKLHNSNEQLEQRVYERTEELHIQAVELEEEVAERQMTQENLQEKALLLEEEIEKRQQVQEELEQLNDELEQRVRERTAELEIKNEELSRMNKLFVGRELRMVELKERIRELEEAKCKGAAYDK